MTNIQAINLLKDLEQSLDDYCELNDEGKTAFRMAITALEVFGNSEQLAPAHPEPQWIPCSERLPESDDAVLVCAKDYFECELYENLTARVCDVFPGETSTQELDFGCKHGECGNCDMESRKPYSIRMHVGWIEADNKWDGELSDSEIVIAWMPLPSPYQEEGGQE